MNYCIIILGSCLFLLLCDILFLFFCEVPLIIFPQLLVELIQIPGTQALGTLSHHSLREILLEPNRVLVPAGQNAIVLLIAELHV